MEPLDAVIRVGADGCDLWAGSQAPTIDQQVVAQIVGVPTNTVRVHTLLGGGSFGRRATPNGDVAGDRPILNPNGVGNTGTATDFVCNDGPGGKTRIVSAASVDPTLGIPCGPLVGSPAAFTDANIVGYVVQDPKARYVQAQTGSVSTVGRNTIPSAGLNIWNMAVLKNITLTERWRLQFRISSFNTFNHTEFQNIDASTNDANFGQVTSAYDPRVLQLGAKIQF